MNCPTCRTPARCTDSRQNAEIRRRRYQCGACGQRFSTGEFVMAVGKARFGRHQLADVFIGKLAQRGANQQVEDLRRRIREIVGPGP
jgi:transcriptional regulator NrdR family protein